MLRERDEELARAEQLLDRAGAGDGALLALEGAAGSGKTRLLREIAARAEERALTVLTGRGSELERGFAFGVLRQALEPALAALDAPVRDALFDGPAATARAALGGPATAARDPYAVLNGLFWLLSALANRNPLLLALDDVHWADEATLRFLGFAALRLDSVPALVAIGTRPAPGDALLAHPDTVVLRLRGLGQRFRAGTGGRAAGRRAGRRVRRRVSGRDRRQSVPARRSDRHPARGWRAPLSRAGPRVAAVNPANVARSVAARLTGLGRDPTALARSLATVGDDATLAFAADVAGLPTAIARAAADALVLAGLLGADLRFEHPLLRTAVLGGIAPGERLRLNEIAARRLQQAGAPSERVAVHLQATEPAGNEQTAAVLADAGRLAHARGAPAAGAALLARALAEPPRDAARLGLLHDLGRAETAAGLPGARERLREVVERSNDAELRARVLTELIWSVGPRPDVMEELLPLFDAIESEDRELALELEAARLGALFIAPGHREEFAAACERRRDLEGGTPAECSVLAWVARHATVRPAGMVAEAAELAERAARHAGASPLWALNMTLVLLPAERFETAERINTTLIEQASRSGSASAFASASAWRALARVAVGDLRGAEADARAAMDSRGMADIYPFQALIPLVETLTEQGRMSEAAALLAESGYAGAMPAARPFTALLIARGRMHAAAGAPEAAAGDLSEAMQRLGEAGSQGVIGLDGRLDAALAFHAVGEVEEAARIAGEALAAARTWQGPRALGGALRVSGLLHGGDEGLERLRAAVEALERSPARLWRAQALVDLGAALRRANRRREAREPLRAGLELSEACAAAGLAERARRELGATGARVPVREGGDALTPSELRIAELAAEGLSNPQIAQRLFVTVKTVEMHLSRSYRKLGISSRGALPQALATTSR